MGSQFGCLVIFPLQTLYIMRAHASHSCVDKGEGPDLGPMVPTLRVRSFADHAYLCKIVFAWCCGNGFDSTRFSVLALCLDSLPLELFLNPFYLLEKSLSTLDIFGLSAVGVSVGHACMRCQWPSRPVRSVDRT